MLRARRPKSRLVRIMRNTKQKLNRKRKDVANEIDSTEKILDLPAAGTTTDCNANSFVCFPPGSVPDRPAANY